jgi:hypothetical protein
LLTAAVVLLALVGVLLLSLPTMLHKVGLHPKYEGPSVALPGKRALVITTSHAVLAAPGETDGPATDVFGSELTHPYYTFLDAGMEVDVASIRGGEIPIDPQSFLFMIRSPDCAGWLILPVWHLNLDWCWQRARASDYGVRLRVHVSLFPFDLS